MYFMILLYPLLYPFTYGLGGTAVKAKRDTVTLTVTLPPVVSHSSPPSYHRALQHCVLRTVYCILRTAYCVLRTVYCVLCTVKERSVKERSVKERSVKERVQRTAFCYQTDYMPSSLFALYL